MDPIAFASLVSLIGQFSSGRKGDEQLELSKFMVWLQEENHEDVKNLIDKNTATTVSIKAILHQDRKTLKRNFEKIDNALVGLTSLVDGFSDLGASLRPDVALSEQAISILRQFEVSGASKVIEIKMWGGVPVYKFVETGGGIDYTDQRFIDDDFNILVQRGFLRHGFNAQGGNLYSYTRLASSLLSQLGQNP